MNNKQILNELNIQITEAALAHLEALLAMEPKNTNIKITVSDPGTIYADLKIAFCLAGTEQLSDFSLKFGIVTIFIEEISLPYLKDAKIDFLPDEANNELSVKAPHLKTMIDDKRTLAEKIQCVIDNEINPILATHGGMIELAGVLEDNAIALLRFGGGCRGCQMANITFQQTVEHMLKQHFPELKEIRNVTDDMENIYP